MSKLVGYRYEIVEMSPGQASWEHTIRYMLHRDTLEDAERVITALNETNYDFSCYAIMLQPVWRKDDETTSKR